MHFSNRGYVASLRSSSIGRLIWMISPCKWCPVRIVSFFNSCPWFLTVRRTTMIELARFWGRWWCLASLPLRTETTEYWAAASGEDSNIDAVLLPRKCPSTKVGNSLKYHPKSRHSRHNPFRQGFLPPFFLFFPWKLKGVNMSRCQETHPRRPQFDIAHASEFGLGKTRSQNAQDFLGSINLIFCRFLGITHAPSWGIIHISLGQTQMIQDLLCFAFSMSKVIKLPNHSFKIPF